MDLDDRSVDRLWTKGWSYLFTELSNVVLDAETDGFDADMQSNALVVRFYSIVLFFSLLLNRYSKMYSFEIL